MRHDPKVGERWRFTNRDGKGTIDFEIESANNSGLHARGRVIASSYPAHLKPGDEQGLSIYEQDSYVCWSKLAPERPPAHFAPPLPVATEILRTVRLWPPAQLDGTGEWSCDVRLDWLRDQDDLPRVEHGIGDTPEEAYERACLIAAAFMAEAVPVGAEAWPSNGIDHLKELA